MSTPARNFPVVWVSNFVTAAGMTAFLPQFPLYLQEMGVEDPTAVRVWAGVLVGAAPLPAAFMGPVWGALGDRIGRKLMMVRAQLAIVVFVGLMAATTSPWQLLALRLAQGVFSGFIAPAMTLVSLSTPEERQGRAAAALQTAVLAGGILGPLLGGKVGDVVGYRATFQLTSLLSLAACGLVWLLAREPEARAKAQGPLAPVALLQGVAREVAGFLSQPALRAALLAAFVMRFAVTLVEPTLALFVATLRGVDPTHLATNTGAVFGAQAAATLLCTPFWGRFGDRHGSRRLLVVCALGSGVFSLSHAFVDHVGLLLLARFGTGAFAAGVVPAVFATASRHSPRHRRGGAYGLGFSSVVLAQALAPSCGGVLAAVLGLRALFVLSALVLVGAAWLQRTAPPAAAEALEGLSPTRSAKTS